jgi:hypothetical protein
MKFKILEIYNARLDERIKRKNFVIERDLLDFNKQSIQDKTRTKEEKEIYNLMKVFARFNKPEDHEKLVQGIIKEKLIRQRIEELKYYRKLGLKTFEEVEVNIYILFFYLHFFCKRFICLLFFYFLKRIIYKRRKKRMKFIKKDKSRSTALFMKIKSTEEVLPVGQDLIQEMRQR